MHLKKHLYTIIATTTLISYSSYALLKTYILPEVLTPVSTIQTKQVTTTAVQNATITNTTYLDENIQINLTTSRVNDTTVYIADIKLNDASYLKTALAQHTFGTNITENTSTIAKQNHAIFAVNGDYYGANNKGYVIKNGNLYRDSVRSTTYDDLVIYQDGTFDTISEQDTTAQALVGSGVIHSFAFGPTLVKNNQIVVSPTDEVKQAMTKNPRTAIGIIDTLHYIVIVSDGRTANSQGLSLYDLAQVMQSYGAKTAYNLDGGGSSTMYFNGKVINNPTTNGNTIKERAVSDIVYIGY